MEYKMNLLLRAIFGNTFTEFIVKEEYLGIKSLSQILSAMVLGEFKQDK